jgi:uncharacterized protein (DUF305 family)
MNKPLKMTLAPVGLLLGGLLLTACGDDGGDNDTTAGSNSSDDSSSAVAQFNDVDVSFAQGMVPHHQQAVEMSELAAERAESVEVKELAKKIEAAQAPEIEQLTTWLEAWGEDAPSGDMGHGDMGHGDTDSEMSGMMTGEDMAMLEDANGAGFDEMFLQMMVEHHEGAVSMAKTEVAEGENPDAIAMAKAIIATQNDEIDQMQQLLERS